jgi:hypothetical protein
MNTPNPTTEDEVIAFLEGRKLAATKVDIAQSLIWSTWNLVGNPYNLEYLRKKGVTSSTEELLMVHGPETDGPVADCDLSPELREAAHARHKNLKAMSKLERRRIEEPINKLIGLPDSVWADLDELPRQEFQARVSKKMGALEKLEKEGALNPLQKRLLGLLEYVGAGDHPDYAHHHTLSALMDAVVYLLADAAGLAERR